jgi:hypothetical protein
MLFAPAGIVEDLKFTQFTLYDTGRWTFLDEKEEFVPRLLMWVASSCSRSDWQLENPVQWAWLAKISSTPKTLGFRDVSENPLPHDSLADCPVPPRCPRCWPRLSPALGSGRELEECL